MSSIPIIQVLDKADYTKQHIISLPNALPLPPLASSSIRIQTSIIALTINNITYARIRHIGGWWSIHLLPESIPSEFSDTTKYGRIAGWGYATIIDSTVPSLPTGHQVYGFIPIGTLPEDLEVKPAETTKAIICTSPHRQQSWTIYNRYSVLPPPTSTSTAHLNSLGWDALMRRLFDTGSVINGYVLAWDDAKRVDTAGARSASWSASDADISDAAVIVLAASGKTSLSFAHQVRHNRPEAAQPRLLVGVSSPLSLDFTKKTGFYDAVLLYSDAESAKPAIAAAGVSKIALVDFGAREGVTESWHAALSPTVSSIIYIGVGSESKVTTNEEIIAGLGKRQALGLRQVNVSAIREAARAMGEQGFQDDEEAAWEGFKREGAIPGVELRWGDGMEDLAKGWDGLATGKIGPDTGLVFKLQTHPPQQPLLLHWSLYIVPVGMKVSGLLPSVNGVGVALSFGNVGKTYTVNDHQVRDRCCNWRSDSNAEDSDEDSSDSTSTEDSEPSRSMKSPQAKGDGAKIMEDSIEVYGQAAAALVSTNIPTAEEVNGETGKVAELEQNNAPDDTADILAFVAEDDGRLARLKSAPESKGSRVLIWNRQMKGTQYPHARYDARLGCPPPPYAEAAEEVVDSPSETTPTEPDLGTVAVNDAAAFETNGVNELVLSCSVGSFFDKDTSPRADFPGPDYVIKKLLEQIEEADGQPLPKPKANRRVTSKSSVLNTTLVSDGLNIESAHHELGEYPDIEDTGMSIGRHFKDDSFFRDTPVHSRPASRAASQVGTHVEDPSGSGTPSRVESRPATPTGSRIVSPAGSRAASHAASPTGSRVASLAGSRSASPAGSPAGWEPLHRSPSYDSGSGEGSVFEVGSQFEPSHPYNTYVDVGYNMEVGLRHNWDVITAKDIAGMEDQPYTKPNEFGSEKGKVAKAWGFVKRFHKFAWGYNDVIDGLTKSFGK
ncbi:uncharacterized protein BDZ99DRAFT_567046 [Mytilinidion resinicola]|uniref:Uncharacterized protein n=1 Tax=Mytilinidion resinicola TaxID=574789 RepID=A0A6A6Z1V9_9PEZI|nr:uncharacterized protein BDZ99DRAFT_567046 [Mytilinidion resinicola]KAF2815152.1 hypothetical protein BDZ99DRAFT_567046 [Mytilinidion resinicola]